jgi:uncharacterized protein YjbI with pentapeptide repeats
MRGRRLLYNGLTILGIVAITVIVLWSWKWGLQFSENWEILQHDPSITAKVRFELYLESTKVIVGILGTFATIAGGVVLYLNFRVANRNTMLAEHRLQLDAKQTIEEAELAKSRLVMEHFSKAVEQLGDNKMEVRLGGIYALEWIAQNSPAEHWTVMEVLTAFVRKQSIEHTINNEQNYLDQVPVLGIVEEDIQAALTVIGRRNDANDPLEGKRLHFQGANLTGAVLVGAKLSKARFLKTCLKYADFSQAVLRNASFRMADLTMANFTEANLVNAYLAKVDLTGANLTGANLTGANLTGANLSQANLKATNLTEADITEAIFEGTENLNLRQIQSAKGYKKARHNNIS